MNKLFTIFSLIRKAYNDFVFTERYGVFPEYQSYLTKQTSVLPYPLKFSSEGMIDYYDMQLDKNGIIMMPHYIGQDTTSKYYYSYLKIAHFIVASYNDYLDNPKDKYLKNIKKHTKYLVENAEAFNGDKNILVWRTWSGVKRYNVPPGHVSSIVQGMVISAMVRAYLIFNDKQFLDIAAKSVNILEIPIEKGGLLANSKYGPVYEEYPRIPYIHVVNGFIFCLFGLYELNFVANSEKAFQLYDNGIKSLIRMLPDWILKYWSKYDLCDIVGNKPVNLATRHYQFLHIDQLLALYAQTGQDIFLENAKILEKQIPKYSLLVYLNKVANINQILKK